MYYVLILYLSRETDCLNFDCEHVLILILFPESFKVQVRSDLCEC